MTEDQVLDDDLLTETDPNSDDDGELDPEEVPDLGDDEEDAE